MQFETIEKFNIQIIKKKKLNSNLSQILSWQTVYLGNDISNIDLKKSELKMKVFYLDKFYDVKINIDSFKLINDLENEIYIKINQYLEHSKDYNDFLTSLSTYLDVSNPSHQKYNDDDNGIQNNTVKNSNKVFEWNPYNSINLKNEDMLNIIKLKKNALKYYDNNPFLGNSINKSKEYTIDIILNELKKIVLDENIEIIIDNIFCFDILIKNFDNENTNQILNKLNINGIKMNILLNSNYYPYYPPEISFKTKLDNNLALAINKLSYFDIKTWNPTNTLIDMFVGIKNILNNHAKLSTVIPDEFEILESVSQNLISINNIVPKSLKDYDFKLDFVKLSINSSSTKTVNDSKYWNSGVGYGCNGRKKWDINKFVESKKIKMYQNEKYLLKLYDEVVQQKDHIMFQNYIIESNIFEIITFFTNQISVVEIDNNFNLYNLIFKIIDIFTNLEWKQIINYELEVISKSLNIFCDEINILLNLNKNIDKNKIKLYEKIMSLKSDNNEHKISDENYIDKLKPFQLDEVKFNSYIFNDKECTPSKICINKLTREISTFKHSLPINYESSIFIKYNENKIQQLKALIIGPKDTPYENGCYIFDIYIPNNYPNDPPLVKLQTTGGGTVRFNPNLYKNGKVCLSLLGTWSGEGGEKWNNETSTILQVLVSIQSLIFVEKPYFNEPGYEKEMGSLRGEKNNFEYNDKRRLSNITWAINNMLTNTPNEFKDIVKIHFKYKKNDIKETINKWYSETKLDKNNFNKIKNKTLELLELI